MPKKLTRGARKGAGRIARVLAAAVAAVVYLVAPVPTATVSGRLALAAVTALAALVAYGLAAFGLRVIGTAAINRKATR